MGGFDFNNFRVCGYRRVEVSVTVKCCWMTIFAYKMLGHQANSHMLFEGWLGLGFRVLKEVGGKSRAPVSAVNQKPRLSL